LQIKHCDSILEHMEGLLGKFQADLGQVSEEIRALQVRAAASWGSLMRQMLGGHWCAGACGRLGLQDLQMGAGSEDLCWLSARGAGGQAVVAGTEEEQDEQA
jgi:hypothetical protein